MEPCVILNLIVIYSVWISEVDMSFTASQKNLNEILSRNIEYCIPLNQRKYVWSETEWAELFEDIFLIDQSSKYKHFLGSLVFAKEEKNQYSVIDGQQRMTTICILFAAIINHLRKTKNTSIANSFFAYLKGNYNGDDYFRVDRKDGMFFLVDIIEMIQEYTEESKVKEAYHSNYGKTDKYNEKLLNCYLYMSSRISEYINSRSSKKDSLVSLKEKLINCEVIEIIVESDVDGYRVFETLNARGIPLEQHELIKNYLYSYLRNKTKRQKLDHHWNKIQNNVTIDSTEHFANFISNYCTHIYGKTKKNEEFKTIRDNTEKSNAEALLNSLYEDSIYYSYFLMPERIKGSQEYDERVYIALTYFKNLNIRQVRPLLLSLFEKKACNIIDNDSFTKCIVMLETFYFLYLTVMKNTTNMIDNSITTLACRINEQKECNPEQLIRNELGKYISEKSLIKTQFTCVGYSNKNKKYRNSSNKKTVNYIFMKFERFYDESDEVAPKIISIEHIMCDSETVDSTSYIGNLLPLSRKINNRIGSKPYSQKVENYKKSRLLSVKRFVEYHGHKIEWTETDINERGKKLADIAIDNIWKF